jgi:hypothetical protein
MALPIKDTPVLKGRDAIRFIKRMHEADSKPAPRKEFIRMKKTYDLIKQKHKEGF